MLTDALEWRCTSSSSREMISGHGSRATGSHESKLSISNDMPAVSADVVVSFPATRIRERIDRPSALFSGSPSMFGQPGGEPLLSAFDEQVGRSPSPPWRSMESVMPPPSSARSWTWQQPRVHHQTQAGQMGVVYLAKRRHAEAGDAVPECAQPDMDHQVHPDRCGEQERNTAGGTRRLFGCILGDGPVAAHCSPAPGWRPSSARSQRIRAPRVSADRVLPSMRFQRPLVCSSAIAA